MNMKANFAIATSKPALVLAEGSIFVHLEIVDQFNAFRYYK